VVGRRPLLFGQSLDWSAVLALGEVEDLARWYDAAGRDLTVDRPIALETIVRVDRGHPRGVVAAIGDESAGIVRSKTADGPSIVRELFGDDVVIGQLGARGNIQTLREMDLIFTVGLVGVGPVLLIEVGQWLIGPGY
jgi:hypothetical protein